MRGVMRDLEARYPVAAMDAARAALLGVRAELKMMARTGEYRGLSRASRDLLEAVALLRAGTPGDVLFHRQTRAAVQQARAAAHALRAVQHGFDLIPDPTAVFVIQDGLRVARRSLARAVALAHTGTHP